MGRIWRSLKMGMKSLLLHKLRSGLTVLGIVFGVGAVIAMMALSEGKSRAALAVIQELGATNIIIRSMKPSQESQNNSSGGRRSVLNYGLKYADYDRIVSTIPTIRKALPIREIRKEIRRNSYKMEGRVVATTKDYLEFQNLTLEMGRFITQRDDETYQNYAVLASETAKALFPYEDPRKQLIRIGSDVYTVIGVTQFKETSAGTKNSGAEGQDFNRDVYIPINTARLRFGERIISQRSGSFEAEETQLTQITVQVGSMDEVMPSADLIHGVVDPHHPKDDVKMTVPYDLLLAAQREAFQSKLLLGFIAAISLLVGGIGIMNIMLATVTERTREIGVRRALGAKQRDIRQQFLVETVVLSGVGGMLGVAVGLVLPVIIHFFFPDQQAFVTLSSILLAFSISVLVGLAAGMYPAIRASKMDPIEALRFA